MKTVSPLTAQTKTRIYGLEYLRAIACIFVVVFHTSPISMDLWYARALHVFIFATAVPIFIIISLFLTELKIDKKGYTLQKSCRLGKIYLIWGWLIPLVLAILAKLISGKKEPLFGSDRGIYQLLINGADYPYKSSSE
ncbi:MAG: acyltransferase family protein [Cyanobacteria bacterium J06600_6]